MFSGNRIKRQLNRLSDGDEVLVTIKSRSNKDYEEKTRAKVVRTETKEGVELVSGFFFTVGQLYEMGVRIDKIK